MADGAVLAELVDELLDHEPPASPEADGDEPTESDEQKAVYGDGAYGTGEALAYLNGKRIDPMVKTTKPQAPDGHFTKDDFDIDLETDKVTCPNGITVPIHWGKTAGQAYFGKACTDCPLRDRCTDSANGRGMTVGLYESELSESRRRQAEPARAADYRATRPKVERKLGHLMRKRHGGRRARMRGTKRVAADFNLLAAAHNLARLAVLGLRWDAQQGWATA